MAADSGMDATWRASALLFASGMDASSTRLSASGNASTRGSDPDESFEPNELDLVVQTEAQSREHLQASENVQRAALLRRENAARELAALTQKRREIAERTQIQNGVIRLVNTDGTAAFHGLKSCLRSTSKYAESVRRGERSGVRGQLLAMRAVVALSKSGRGGEPGSPASHRGVKFSRQVAIVLVPSRYADLDLDPGVALAAEEYEAEVGSTLTVEIASDDDDDDDQGDATGRDSPASKRESKKPNTGAFELMTMKRKRRAPMREPESAMSAASMKGLLRGDAEVQSQMRTLVQQAAHKHHDDRAHGAGAYDDDHDDYSGTEYRQQRHGPMGSTEQRVTWGDGSRAPGPGQYDPNRERSEAVGLGSARGTFSRSDRFGTESKTGSPIGAALSMSIRAASPDVAGSFDGPTCFGRRVSRRWVPDDGSRCDSAFEDEFVSVRERLGLPDGFKEDIDCYERQMAWLRTVRSQRGSRQTVRMRAVKLQADKEGVPKRCAEQDEDRDEDRPEASVMGRSGIVNAAAEAEKARLQRATRLDVRTVDLMAASLDLHERTGTRDVTSRSSSRRHRSRSEAEPPQEPPEGCMRQDPETGEFVWVPRPPTPPRVWRAVVSPDCRDAERVRRGEAGDVANQLRLARVAASSAASSDIADVLPALQPTPPASQVSHLPAQAVLGESRIGGSVWGTPTSGALKSVPSRLPRIPSLGCGLEEAMPASLTAAPGAPHAPPMHASRASQRRDDMDASAASRPSRQGAVRDTATTHHTPHGRSVPTPSTPCTSTRPGTTDAPRSTTSPSPRSNRLSPSNARTRHVAMTFDMLGRLPVPVATTKEQRSRDAKRLIADLETLVSKDPVADVHEMSASFGSDGATPRTATGFAASASDVGAPAGAATARSVPAPVVRPAPPSRQLTARHAPSSQPSTLRTKHITLPSRRSVVKALHPAADAQLRRGVAQLFTA